MRYLILLILLFFETNCFACFEAVTGQLWFVDSTGAARKFGSEANTEFSRAGFELLKDLRRKAKLSTPNINLPLARALAVRSLVEGLFAKTIYEAGVAPNLDTLPMAPNFLHHLLSSLYLNGALPTSYRSTRGASAGYPRLFNAYMAGAQATLNTGSSWGPPFPRGHRVNAFLRVQSALPKVDSGINTSLPPTFNYDGKERNPRGFAEDFVLPPRFKYRYVRIVKSSARLYAQHIGMPNIQMVSDLMFVSQEDLMEMFQGFLGEGRTLFIYVPSVANLDFSLLPNNIYAVETIIPREEQD